MKKKALWTQFVKNQRGETVNPRREYIRQKKSFLKAHPICAVWPLQGQRHRRAVDIHHMRGRLGSLLTDERFWLAVSREGHDWIHAHPDEARRLGYLCHKGLWNSVPHDAHE